MSGNPKSLFLATAAILHLAAAASAPAGDSCWSYGTDLPVRRSNNAVAYFEREGNGYLLSCLGIDETKLFSGIQNDAWLCDIAAGEWTRAPDLPTAGRIAASATTLRGQVWVIGGYDVAANGDEVSHDDANIYDPETGQWLDGPSTPLPIDDHVQVVRDDRWLYLVGGWSNSGTTRSVQVYDAESGEWAISPQQFPIGLFGHSGAIAGDAIHVFDGVIDLGQFRLIRFATRGVISADNPASIAWSDLRPDGEHDGLAGYRMGVGALGADRLLLVGGTNNPYNYDGVGYNGQPSNPLNRALAIDASDGSDAGAELLCADPPPTPIMDLRGMAWSGSSASGENFYWIVGGMTTGQEVTNKTQRLDASALLAAPSMSSGAMAR